MRNFCQNVLHLFHAFKGMLLALLYTFGVQPAFFIKIFEGTILSSTFSKLGFVCFCYKLVDQSDSILKMTANRISERNLYSLLSKMVHE